MKFPGGFKGAMPEFLARHADEIQRIVRRAATTRGVTGLDVDDVVQEVFMKLMTLGMPDFDSHMAFQRWLRVLTKKVIMDIDSRARYRKVLSRVGDACPLPYDEHDSDELQPSFPGAERAWREEEARLSLETMMKLLPEHERRIVSAFYLRGNTIYEISKEFGLSRDQVAYALRKARRKLEQVSQVKRLAEGA